MPEAEDVPLDPYRAYIDAGLYDPASPDAVQRAELIDFLASVGCSIEEMLFAESEGRLFGLAGDRLLMPGRNTHTWGEVAAKVGMAPENLMRAVRAYGLPDVGLDVPIASDQDVEVLTSFAMFSQLQGEADALAIARVMGSSLQRIADAISQAVRGNNETMQLENAASPTETAVIWAAMAGLVPQVGAQLDPVFRHHLVSVRRHFEASASADLSGSRQMRLGVGFVDLTGFTALTSRLTPAELTRLLMMFEDQTTRAITAHSGRVVKFIGDEVMYVAPTAEQAATIAAVIVEGAPTEMPARVGLAYGVVLAIDGDYFGDPVNLAARLVDRAQPSQILAPAEFLTQFGSPDGWTAEAVEAFSLRGISDPVSSVSLHRT